MDPDVTLAELRQLAERLAEHPDHDVTALCERVQALDEWLCKGGAIPASWRPF
jgi:hypothetical protein